MNSTQFSEPVDVGSWSLQQHKELCLSIEGVPDANLSDNYCVSEHEDSSRALSSEIHQHSLMKEEISRSSYKVIKGKPHVEIVSQDVVCQKDIHMKKSPPLYLSFNSKIGTPVRFSPEISAWHLPRYSL